MEDFQDKERKDQFKNQGHKASDVYYINQDARNNRLAAMKEMGPQFGAENDAMYQVKRRELKDRLVREAKQREDMTLRQAAEDDVARQRQAERKKLLALEQMKDQ